MSGSFSWKSTKVRCVARSTLGSEIKFTKSADATCCVNQLREKLLVQASPQMTTYTNNKSLKNSVNTTSQMSDLRLHVCY